MCAQCTDAHLASAYVSIAVGNRLFRLSILYMETCHSFFQYLLIVFVDEQLVKARLLWTGALKLRTTSMTKIT